MKISIEYDLEKDEVLLTTDYSHRRFTAKRQFTCRECGTVNNNPLIEILRAIALYEKAEKVPKDVSKAVLAYDLDEILKRMGYETTKRSYTSTRKRVGDGTVTVRTVTRYNGRKAELNMDELGDLE